MKTKLGRPKLPKGEAKTEIIRVRVSPKEYELVETRAKAIGKEISDWARATMLNATNHG